MNKQEVLNAWAAGYPGEPLPKRACYTQQLVPESVLFEPEALDYMLGRIAEEMAVHFQGETISNIEEFIFQGEATPPEYWIIRRVGYV